MSFDIVGACAHAIDRWFFSGVMTSKWIGLSEYEQAMKKLQKQSEIWEDVALALGIVGFRADTANLASSVQK